MKLPIRAGDVYTGASGVRAFVWNKVDDRVVLRDYSVEPTKEYFELPNDLRTNWRLVDRNVCGRVVAL